MASPIGRPFDFIEQTCRVLAQRTRRVCFVLTCDLCTRAPAKPLDAISQAEALRPDVVVVDLEMPVMDGYEAARQIKTHCPACRVVALTVHAGEAERQRTFLAGVDAFVVKGASLETLVQAIRNEGSQLRQNAGGSA